MKSIVQQIDSAERLLKDPKATNSRLRQIRNNVLEQLLHRHNIPEPRRGIKKRKQQMLDLLQMAFHATEAAPSISAQSDSVTPMSDSPSQNDHISANIENIAVDIDGPLSVDEFQAEGLIKDSSTATYKLNRVKKDVCRRLCERYSLPVLRDALKADLIKALKVYYSDQAEFLLASYGNQPIIIAQDSHIEESSQPSDQPVEAVPQETHIEESSPPFDPQESCIEDLSELLIGFHFVEECQKLMQTLPADDAHAPSWPNSEPMKTSVGPLEASSDATWVDHPNKAELDVIRKFVTETTRPSWHRGPPVNIGAGAAGKLKAEQWRSSIEFDLLVAVARLYSPEKCTYPKESAEWHRRVKQFQCTMALVLAIMWGTSDKTSKDHLEKYMTFMKQYLQHLLELYPNRKLLPNHHGALHIGDFLLRYGPLCGWWMFPYERLIGKLQKIRTNGKIGELEGTMMKSLCEASILKTHLAHADCPKVLKETLPLLERAWKDSTDGSHNRDTKDPKDTVPDHILRLIRDVEKHHKNDLPIKARFLRSISINGVRFTTQDSLERDSAIFFQPVHGCRPVPGHIVHILRVGDVKDLLVIRRLLTLARDDDPFHNYPDFGFVFTSGISSEAMEIIPTSMPVFHSISQPWETGIALLRPLNRSP